MKFIFWNINKKPLVDELAELIYESQCDLCVLAESNEEIVEQVILCLNEKYEIECSLFDNPGCDRITFIMIGQLEISLLNQNEYFSLVKIRGNKEDLIAGFVHFPSQLYATMESIGALCATLHGQVAEEERRFNIHMSLLMGDFNVNPFDRPMISFRSLGATNGQQCSLRGTISSYGDAKELFYNPMWTLYAKYKERPGSYRYTTTTNHVLTWHFLDQVIIRPSLIDYFDFDILSLIMGTRNFNYLNQNQFPKSSDHLPLMCEIDI